MMEALWFVMGAFVGFMTVIVALLFVDSIAGESNVDRKEKDSS